MITKPQSFSLVADSAAQRYGMLVDGFKAIYARALGQQDFGTERSLLRATRDADLMAQRFMDGERAAIEQTLPAVASEALSLTRSQLAVAQSDALPDDVSAHLSAFETYLSGEIAMQLARDIVTLTRSLQDTRLRVHVASRAQDLPIQTALMQHRIAGAITPSFVYRDRRSAQWTSVRLVRTTWRHNLLSLYNDVVLMTLADHGVATAMIQHDDPASEFHAMEVALTDATSLPTYADIRGAAFHPNANAVMTRAF